MEINSPVKNPDAIPPNGWHITVILADGLREDKFKLFIFKLLHFSNEIYLPSHVAWSGVMESFSFELWAEFKPVNAGINIVE